MNHKIEDVRQRETLKALTSFLIKEKPWLKPEKYLDLGCGDGSFTLEVADVLNAWKVYGVDISGRGARRSGAEGH
ncbi:MAG: class I SAM-dependent methyltransferase [Thermoproteota archaeon]